MKVRKMRPREEEIFLRMERETIYPKLSLEKMQQWVDGEAWYTPLVFVLDNEGEIVGGAVWEVQDHLDETQIVLQLDTLFIKKEWRGQGLGRQLLNESLAAANLYYQDQGLEVVGFLIQTTSLNGGAIDFYQKVLRFPYSVIYRKMGKAIVSVFLVACD